MKTTFTFEECSRIFAQVGKVETAVDGYATLSEQYNAANEKFDGEYAKHDYSFFGAPEELHELFNVKSALMNKRDNQFRTVVRLTKAFAVMIGAGDGYVDISEERLLRFVEKQIYSSIPGMVDRVKHLALEAAKKISI